MSYKFNPLVFGGLDFFEKGSTFITKVSATFEVVGEELKVKAKGVTDAMLAETYALLVGRAGGQILAGGTAASNNLTLESTSNATKGKILLGAASAYDELNVRLAIGVVTPASTLEAKGKQPAEVLGAGTAAPNILKLTGATGGNSSGTEGASGGIGATVTIEAGIGGTAPSALEASTGGSGGNFSANAAAGGAAAVAGTGENTGGKGGALSFISGTGGQAGGKTSGVQKGGAGGAVKFTAGSGAQALNGTGEQFGGEGGTVTIGAGGGGAGTTANGAPGNIVLVTVTTGLIKLEGAVEMSKGFGAFKHAAPAAQHAAIGAVTNPGAFKKGAQGFETEAEAKAVIEKLEALTTAVTAHTAVLKEYGQTA